MDQNPIQSPKISLLQQNEKLSTHLSRQAPLDNNKQKNDEAYCINVLPTRIFICSSPRTRTPSRGEESPWNITVIVAVGAILAFEDLGLRRCRRG